MTTYLIDVQACGPAEFHFLLLRRIWRCSVGVVPIFEQIGGLLGKIASALPVAVDNVVRSLRWLELDIAVSTLILIAWVGVCKHRGP
jgi:hypothetical protein